MSINKSDSNMEEEKSLSDKDKNLIKQAVLESAVKNARAAPSALDEKLCQAIKFIDLYGR